MPSRVNLLVSDRCAAPLLYALCRFQLVEARRAFLRFGDSGAIPYLVECLSDGRVRQSAAAVLLEFGQEASVRSSRD